MTRNTKEISLIQIRSGKRSEMPKALHQSEFGLARDTNNLYIGNASNSLLKNRTVFPYQNLEILTEFSDLKDYFKYSYENNITNANGLDRLKLKEFLPIVISCHQEDPTIDSAGAIVVNTHPISIPVCDMYGFVSAINAESYSTGVYATVFPGTRVITFISVTNELKISARDPSNPNDTGIIDAIGFIEESYDISMPIRKVTEKLDDFLNITDFGIRGDGTNVAKEVYSSLVEVYKKVTNSQFYRNVFFPAGNYVFDTTQIDDNTPYFTPFPLISNLHVRGEGIDRTIITNNTTNTLLSCIDDTFYAEYDNDNYGKGNLPSNIVIEDMTFESTASATLGRLIGCSNVTFNRVKFVGNPGANTLFLLEGIEKTVENPVTHEMVTIESPAFNITFNECIFDKAGTAIDFSEMDKNVTINNCTFTTISTPAIKVGNGTGSNVKAVLINGCHFEDISPLNSNTSVIELGINSEYITTENCTFDKDIIEKTEARGTIPYIDKGVGEQFTSTKSYAIGDRCIYEHKYYIATSAVTQGSQFNPSDWQEYQRYNYTDILDINTDERKLLRFKFAQPQWEYINYLTNLNGDVVLTVDGKDSEITASNGLNITENANGIEIKSVKDGNVTISLNPLADMFLGKGTTDLVWKQDTEYAIDDVVVHNGIIYECTYPHTSGSEFDETKWNATGITQIVINKVLQLNDNMISNRDGSEDIKIEPATNKVIEIVQTEETTTPYENMIVDKDNAIPNVAFVKNYSTSSLIKHITKEDIANIDATGLIEVGTFPSTQFSGNIHITGVTVNVRNPFYKVVPYLTTTSADYQANYTYYKGDVVKGVVDGATAYAVIKKTHEATDNVIADNDNMEIVPTTYTSDIKFAEVIGINYNGQYNLTETYSPNYVSYNTVDFEKVSKIDIQKNNLFGYTSVEAFDTTKTYGLVNKIVSFQDRNYMINKPENSEGYTGETYTSAMLHRLTGSNTVSLSRRLYDEGFIYTFDEDRNYNIGIASADNPYSVNYAGGRVCIRLYAEDGTLITSENKNTLLVNPAGDLIVKIDFVKDEV